MPWYSVIARTVLSPTFVRRSPAWDRPSCTMSRNEVSPPGGIWLYVVSNAWPYLSLPHGRCASTAWISPRIACAFARKDSANERRIEPLPLISLGSPSMSRYVPKAVLLLQDPRQVGVVTTHHPVEVGRPYKAETPVLGHGLVDDLPGLLVRILHRGAHGRQDRRGQRLGVGRAEDPWIDLELDELSAWTHHGLDQPVVGPRAAGDLKD